MIDLPLVVKAALTGLLLLAAWSDARRFLIPNLYPAIIIAVFPLAWWGGFPFDDPLWSHMAHFAVTLLIGMALFRFRWFGGGDVKLYAAVALWFGLPKAMLLLVITAVSGGVIVLIRMMFHVLTLWHGAGTGRMRLFDRRIAYGVAIAAGGILSIWTWYA
ncbi:A24 family peptidase [Sphingopyxis sp. 22461]|uniref:A24 family peptidase n=1 Tax=Sphingopyxis sp. 22461 TaxID=3453923 RepID=UPI003F84F352